jgi:hypothetical protein
MGPLGLHITLERRHPVGSLSAESNDTVTVAGDCAAKRPMFIQKEITKEET